MRSRISIEPAGISDFCRRRHTRRLALFGSVLRDDFGPGSGVDVLVESAPEARVGLITLADDEEQRTAIP